MVGKNLITPLQAHMLTCTAYRNAIRSALERGDKASALRMQEALKEIERKRDDAQHPTTRRPNT